MACSGVMGGENLYFPLFSGFIDRSVPLLVHLRYIAVTTGGDSELAIGVIPGNDTDGC